MVLAGLLLLFAISQLFNKREDRSFKSELFALDTSSIDKVILHTQADGHKEVLLSKSGSTWKAKQGSKQVDIEAGSLDGILKELLSIKVKSIAIQSKERFQEYEISDSMGSRVQVYAGAKKIADFYSGKFGFNPQTNSMISYIREAGESTVYAVDGFQSMTFNASFSNFRDKTISQIAPEQITSINLNSNGQNHALIKNNNTWSIDGKPLMDSTAILNYLNSLQALRGTDIVDDINPTTPAHHATIMTADQSINIDIYPSQDSIKPFLIHSSINSSVYFKEDSMGTYQSMVTGLNNLLKVDTKKKK